MNKCEQVGAQELLAMLSDVELMSVKDTVTKGMFPTNTVQESFSCDNSKQISPFLASGSHRCVPEMFTISNAVVTTEESSKGYIDAVFGEEIDSSGRGK
jgi:hypothetical protein